MRNLRVLLAAVMMAALVFWSVSAKAEVDCYWSGIECKDGKVCAWDPNRQNHRCMTSEEAERLNMPPAPPPAPTPPPTKPGTKPDEKSAVDCSHGRWIDPFADCRNFPEGQSRNACGHLALRINAACGFDEPAKIAAARPAP